MNKWTYRYHPDSESREAVRPRTLYRSGSRFVTRTWRGWGLGARTRRNLALMLRGCPSLPIAVYEIEALDTGLLRPHHPNLVLHRHADITQAETEDPGSPEEGPQR